MVSLILKNIFHSKAPIPVKIIAWYFLLNGIANIVETSVSQIVQGHSIPNTLSFLYISLPGMLSNDPFTHAVIGIPFYDALSIFIKSLITIFVLLFAGYKLLKMEKRGWDLGIFIVAFGLLFSVVLSHPIDYVQNIFGGIGIFGLISEWTVMSIVFLINIFALIYLPTHKKLFAVKKDFLTKNILILGLVVVIALIIGAYYAGKNSTLQVQSSTVTSNASPITQVSQLPTQPQNYPIGQDIFGISINYPKGWVIKYNKVDMSSSKDFNAKVRIYFDFIAPGSTDVQDGLFFDVYDPQADFNQWINKYSPYTTKDLTVAGDSTIGSKPAFYLATTVSQYGATVVLGTNYSYDISHTQGAGSQLEIGNVFYPMIHID